MPRKRKYPVTISQEHLIVNARFVLEWFTRPCWQKMPDKLGTPQGLCFSGCSRNYITLLSWDLYAVNSCIPTPCAKGRARLLYRAWEFLGTFTSNVNLVYSVFATTLPLQGSAYTSSSYLPIFHQMRVRVELTSFNNCQMATPVCLPVRWENPSSLSTSRELFPRLQRFNANFFTFIDPNFDKR